MRSLLVLAALVVAGVAVAKGIALLALAGSP